MKTSGFPHPYIYRYTARVPRDRFMAFEGEEMTWMRQPSWQGIALFSVRMEFWRSTRTDSLAKFVRDGQAGEGRASRRYSQGRAAIFRTRLVSRHARSALLFSTALAYTPCHSESDIDVDLILFFVFVFDSAAETWLFCLGYGLSPNFRRSFCTKESFNCT